MPEKAGEELVEAAKDAMGDPKAEAAPSEGEIRALKSQEKIADKTKYSIVLFLKRLGALPKESSFTTRSKLWAKYEGEIKKDPDGKVTAKEKYTGSAEQNTDMMNYIKNRMRNQKEIFDVGTQEFTPVQRKKEVVKEAAKDERTVLRKKVDTMKDESDKRDAAYLKSIEKDLELFEPKYEGPKEFKEDLGQKVTIEATVYEKWGKSKDNANWININGTGRNAVEKNLAAMGVGINDLKASMKGPEVSLESIFQKVGYKDIAEMMQKYAEFTGAGSYGDYLGWGRDYSDTAKKIEKLKAEKGDPKAIAREEEHLKAAKDEVDRARPKAEKDRPETERLMNAIKNGRKMMKVLGDKDQFFYNEQQASKKEKEVMDPENQKTLDFVNSIFPRNENGGIKIEELSKNAATEENGNGKVAPAGAMFERETSYAAAYEAIEEKILDKDPKKTLGNAVKLMNEYMKLALIKNGKGNEFSHYEIGVEQILDIGKGNFSKVLLGRTSLIQMGYIENLRLQQAGEKAEKQEIIEHKMTKDILAQYRKEHPEATDEEIRTITQKVDQQFAVGISLDGKGAFAVQLTDKVWFGVQAGLDGSGNIGITCKLLEGKVGDTKLELSGGGGFGTSGIGVFIGVKATRGIGKWDASVGVGVGAGLKDGTLHFGVGGVVSFEQNIDRAYNAELEEKYKKAGISDIEKAADKYEAIVKHPEFGKRILETITEIEKEKGTKLSDTYKRTIALEIYKSIKEDIQSKTTEEFDPGWFNGGGIAVSFVPPFLMPYITINFGKKVRVLRLIDMKSGEIPDEKIRAQLEEDLMKASGKEYVNIGAKGKIEMNEKGERTMSINREFKGGGTVEALNKDMKGAKVEFMKTADGMLQMNIKNAKNANIRVHLDPQLENAHLIHDEENFFLNVNLEQNLIITRKDYHYPYLKDGANHHVDIYIKKDLAGERVIEGTEEALLEKNLGYAIKEAGLKSKIGGNNIVDYATFKKMQAEGKIQKFKIQTKEEYEKRMEALGYTVDKTPEGTIEKPRDDIKDLTEEYMAKLSQKERKDLKRETTEYNPSLTTNYTKVIENFEKFLTKKGLPKLNTAERDIFRNRLIELTFRDVTKKTPAERKELLKHDMAWMRKIFMRFMGPGNEAQKNIIADAVMSHLAKTTFADSEKQKITPEILGDSFVSMVGTQKIVGARRSENYSGDAYSLINPKEFKATSSDAGERAAAKALLEITSPFNTKTAREFLRSTFALKLAPITEKILDDKELAIYNDLRTGKATPDTSPEHNALYKKYVKMATIVREAEKAGKSEVNLGPDFNNIMVQMDVSTSVGLFERCQNFTITGKENFTTTGGIHGGGGGEAHIKVTPELESSVNQIKVGVGIPEKTIRKIGGGGNNESTGQVQSTTGDGSGGNNPGGAPPVTID